MVVYSLILLSRVDTTLSFGQKPRAYNSIQIDLLVGPLSW